QIPHQSSSSSARPLRTPCWQLESLLRSRSGDTGGAGAGDGAGAAVPGTRFALGVRLGRPELVTPPIAGSRAATAACQPVSAGEDHSSLRDGGGAEGSILGIAAVSLADQDSSDCQDRSGAAS